jgi:hypothetical protein
VVSVQGKSGITQRTLDRIRLLTPLGFLLLVLMSIVVSRLGLILITPKQNDHIDLSIYREVGQLVINGIDPYDFSAQPDLRERFRTDGVGAVAWVSETRDRYDSLVSSNLPLSTLLYAAVEFATRGSPFLWRLVLISGDILIALCAFFFLRRAGLSLDSSKSKLAFAATVLFYPSLLLWGTAIPEEKQFQTALMLLLAGLLIFPSRNKRTPLTALGIGAVSAGGILFKALGGALLPLVVKALSERSKAEVAAGLIGFTVVVLLASILFSGSFIPLVLHRAYAGSTSLPGHSSPWILLPWKIVVSYFRPLILVVVLTVCVAALIKQKIDLLNFLAATVLAFICLWITNGSMDRMNITMIFALMCLVTLSIDLWSKVAMANTVVQAAVYIVGLGLFGATAVTLGFCDAVATVFFLTSYFWSIFHLEPAVKKTFLEWSDQPIVLMPAK